MANKRIDLGFLDCILPRTTGPLAKVGHDVDRHFWHRPAVPAFMPALGDETASERGNDLLHSRDCFLVKLTGGGFLLCRKARPFCGSLSFSSSHVLSLHVWV